MAKYQDALNKKVYGIKGQVQRITGGATPPKAKTYKGLDKNGNPIYE
jgi:hypothetical protein